MRAAATRLDLCFLVYPPLTGVGSIGCARAAGFSIVKPSVSLLFGPRGCPEWRSGRFFRTNNYLTFLFGKHNAGSLRSSTCVENPRDDEGLAGGEQKFKISARKIGRHRSLSTTSRTKSGCDITVGPARNFLHSFIEPLPAGQEFPGCSQLWAQLALNKTI